MTTDTQSLRDDLAYLRALVQAGEDNQRTFGEAYFAGGIVYGGQMLLHAAQGVGLLGTAPNLLLAVGLGPTLVFIVALIWIIRRHQPAETGGMVGKAVAAVFGAVGLSNLALIAVVGSVAWREHSVTTWLIYPCAVFVLQGAAWLVAFMLRRRAWLGLVSAGWFATAIAMAICVERPGYFIAFAGFGLVACMALPGWAMLQQSRLPS